MFSFQHNGPGEEPLLTLSHVWAQAYLRFISVPLALEYEAVLMRQRRELNLSYLDVTDLVDAVCSLSQHHNIHFLWRPSLPDEKDEMILELAVAARCEYIITYNQRDFRGADQFGLKILKPRTFLQRIGVLP